MILHPVAAALTIVAGTYAPFFGPTFAVSPSSAGTNLIEHAPVLGILVVVVALFLIYMERADKRREATLSHIGNDCHVVQREGHEVMASVREHMEQDALARGRQLAVIERLEKLLDIREAELRVLKGD